MSKFNPEQFLAEPDQTVFEKLKKDDLMSLAKHVDLDPEPPIVTHTVKRISVKE